METTTSIWKSCFKYGIILGLVSVVLSVLFYVMDLMFASWVFLPIIIVTLVALFLLQRSYRDTYENGYITYGRALGSGVVMLLYSAIVGAIFAYLLYAVIDPGLVDKSLAAAQAKLEAKGMPEAAIEAATKVQQKMLQPWVISLTTIVNTMFMGTIMALITSIFVTKKGNPLIDNE
ncbi:MAG TPA: DUF4199 domain-containing protein [Bacteroidales bacterium]|nr:DUF4199 domain-containing protein [Bacteroidales bacterium]HPT11476.1 DUF4199 domain-containing protein [Bacteroidales bacterium]